MIGLLAVYIAVSFFAYGSLMFLQISGPLIDSGQDWVYFIVLGLTVTMLCFIGSVFMTGSQLFNARDNELLLGMPIRPSAILWSRLIFLLLFNYIYAVVFAIPAFIIYAFAAPPDILFTLIYIASVLLLPIIALALSCIFGGIIEYLTSKMKNKNIFSVIYMFALFIVYMYFMMNLNKYMQTLIERGEEIGAAIKKAFPPLYFFADGIAERNIISFLIFAAMCLIPFSLIVAALSKMFFRIVSANKNRKTVKYVRKEMKSGSPAGALFKKEASRFFTLPIYIFNCGIGAIFALIFGAAVLLRGDTILAAITGVFQATMPFNISGAFIISVLLSLISTMTITTSSAVSLEGKCLPILKSLPVRASDIFLAKVNLNLLIGVPSLILASLVIGFRLNLTLYEKLAVLLLPAATQTLTAFFGIIVNMHLPRFNWTSETAAIKQSLSVMISLFGMMALFILPVALYIIILNNVMASETFSLMLAAAFVGASMGMRLYIKKRSQKIFDDMQ